jgi:hypothetical protein
MLMEDIKTVLSHIQAREAAVGAMKSFRFSKYWHKNELCDAEYVDESLAEGCIRAVASTLEGAGLFFNCPGGSRGSPGNPTGAAEDGNTRHSKGRQDAAANVAKDRSSMVPSSARHEGGTSKGSGNQSSVAALHAAVLNSAAATDVYKNTLIDQQTMSMLTTLGVPTSIPINGPEDGQPMYYMPRGGSALIAANNIDPVILQNQPFMGSSTNR